ncbi:MAG: hypothetical protein WC325_13645 [Candidatus Bathyarchaeia archaeon]|jgi:hypothetical protein
MAKLFINYLILGVSVQAVCYLFWAFNLFGGLIEYPLGDVSSLSTLFSIDTFSVLIGIGGAIGIGLAALLLKQGTYAIYAMLLWAIGCMFKVVQTFVLVIPNTIGALLPASTNPNPALFPVNPILVVVSLFFALGAWLFMFGLVIQRDVI